MFFGSESQYASHRGVDIADILLSKIREYGDQIEIMLNATAVGFYEDNVVTVLKDEKEYFKIKARSILCATGAYEKSLAFPNNDLPGIYGAGAVQTLMNVYGIRPGDRVLMVGAGNIGVIVSYQLLQAGIQVVAVLDAAPRIGAYLVHASKLARMGVPILTSHTVKEAIGTDCLEAAVVCEVDDRFRPIPPIIAPQRMETRAPPIEWAVFQIDIFEASSLGGIQWTRSRLHGANPTPCAMLLRISSTAMDMMKALMKSGPSVVPVIQWLRSAVHPNRKLISTLADKPIAKCQRALARSAMTPLINLETP